MTFDVVIARIRRALLLDPGAYEEARDDATFTPFAAGGAVIAAFVGGLGAFLWSSVILDDTGDFFVEAFILGSIFLAILWIAGVFLMYAVLSMAFAEETTWDGLLRVVTIAHIPFAISVLVFIPGIGFAFGVLAIAAMFFYSNFAIRSAYAQIDPMRVMLAVLAGFAVWLVLLPLLTSPSNQFAPGTFVYEWSEDVVEDLSSTSAEDLGIPDISTE
jgi:hypothetical protein